ncbi:MAG: arsenate reductase (glutaredoxin) [Capnocytophaga sp.]|nr:arsenate reductase (glutaredoxin) [Capnocytophaga sp.]
MENIKIYHNARCSKSRCGLELVKNSGQPYTIVNYLEQPPAADELKIILSKLKIPPIELVRKKETIWKEKFENQSLTDEQIIQAMAMYPKLIERPIVVLGDKAVIGRPPENIENLLKENQ